MEQPRKKRKEKTLVVRAIILKPSEFRAAKARLQTYPRVISLETPTQHRRKEEYYRAPPRRGIQVALEFYITDDQLIKGKFEYQKGEGNSSKPLEVIIHEMDIGCASTSFVGVKYRAKGPDSCGFCGRFKKPRVEIKV